ncbi:hypothetical protein T484DRAFT_1630073 [Baffinella frigidus]|nr:hypothetical protein T484DRAFT_1630073 [Cryptophyta sp. CCMP2293]
MSASAAEGACKPTSLPTFNPQPSTLNPQPSTLNPQPSALNPQPSNNQPATLRTKPGLLGAGWRRVWDASRVRESAASCSMSASAAEGACKPTSLPTLNPQPSTLNPQPSTLNPQPSTLNPQP